MKKPYYSVGFEDFCRLATQGNLIPVYQEILADFETPVSAFSKINKGPTAFLFESVEGGENWARYSFLGNEASLIMWEEGEELVIREGKKTNRQPLAANPLTTFAMPLNPMSQCWYPDYLALWEVP